MLILKIFLIVNALIILSISLFILIQYLKIKHQFKKIRDFPLRVQNRVKEMMKDPMNKTIIKGNYIASVRASLLTHTYFDPILTLYVDKKPINIKLSDIIKIISNS